MSNFFKYSFFIFLFISVSAIPFFPAGAEEVGKDIKNYDRFEPEFYGEGVRVRSFLVKPQINTDLKYSDNIYAKNTGKVSDSIFVFRPILEARSNWNRHEIGFKFAAETGNYLDKSDENYADYNLTTNGKIDIKNGLNLNTELSYYKSHEGRGSPDDRNGVKPNTYKEFVARTTLAKDKTRVTASITPEIRVLDYDNNSTPLGVMIRNDERNRKQTGVNARVGYELRPGLTTFINTSLNKISYDNNLTINRDSKGYSVTTGVETYFSGKLKGEVYLGYLSQKYDNSAFQSNTGVDFGGALLWQATNLTSVKFESLRSVNETVLSGSSGYLQTASAITVDHELLRNVILRAKGEYRNDKYKGINRDDDVYGATLAGKYFINRRIALKTQYNYENRSSSQAGNDYTDNSIIAGISLSM